MMGSSAVITRQYVVVIPPRRPSACSSRWFLNSRASTATKRPSHSCAGCRFAHVSEHYQARASGARTLGEYVLRSLPSCRWRAHLGDRTSGYRGLFRAGTGTQLPAGATRPLRHLVCLCVYWDFKVLRLGGYTAPITSTL